MKEIIEDFLNTELTDEGMYNCMFEFIISPEIRNGEFECNEYIVKKMDHHNFIIYKEYTNRNETKRGIFNATSIYAKILIEEIQLFAKKMGFKIVHENEQFYYEHLDIYYGN